MKKTFTLTLGLLVSALSVLILLIDRDLRDLLGSPEVLTIGTYFAGGL